ncbi:hypothetical protein CLG96_08745 [Sphingomonas oleivorans]|uniref:Twin-arginine translocation pathway signal protein n=1 Tax=Sphingomonas oleivorans TaxID=1735121 RepID=A0A2T5FYA2_9SPHN|nr:murein L,D-transpeptidase catalytic domain family protein [Sphingomonas oleivorans]PTQ11513.1 hypothetical protein CLG96_08745 [Sphingomonas oleivorans]
MRAISRRHLLRSATLGLTGLAVERAAAASFMGGSASAARGVSPRLLESALRALARHHRRIWSQDVIAIADFSSFSARPRLYLIDILDGRTTSLLVAHGRGSDPDNCGFLRYFSNLVGSKATSEGAYLTGERYEGMHGTARRLIGLDPSNDRAEERAIVIHSAKYVGQDILARRGRLGRSEGCFAVSPQDIVQVLARLGTGRLLYAGKA